MKRQQRRGRGSAVEARLPRFARDAPRLAIAVTLLGLAAATAAASAPFVIATIQPALMPGLALGALCLLGPAALTRRLWTLPWWPVLGGFAAAAAGTVVLAILPEGKQDAYLLTVALALAGSVAAAVFYAAPVLALVTVRRRPSHDGVDATLLVVSAWLGVVAVLSVAASWVARTGAIRLPCGAGGWTMAAQSGALLLGGALAGWLLLRDSARVRWWKRLTTGKASLRLLAEVSAPAPKPPALLRAAPGSALLVATGDSEGTSATATTTSDTERVLRLLLRRRTWAGTLMIVQLGGAAMGVADWLITREPLTDVTQLSLGPRHSCALRGDGSVWCWGDTAVVGKGVLASALRPNRVAGLDGVVQLSSGMDESCALLADGSVWCWDEVDDVAGRLMQVEGLPEASRISTGGTRSCAVVEEGQVWCWGRASVFDPTPTELIAEPMPTLGRARLLAVGGEGVCVLADEGVLCSWGRCPARALTLPSGHESRAAGNEIQALAIAGQMACALRADGALLCHQHAGACDSAASMDEVGVHEDVVALAAGAVEICTLSRAGKVICLDRDGNSERFSAGAGGCLAVGWGHYCVTTAAKEVECWGRNLWGQLGDNTRREREAPVTVGL